MLKVVVWVLSAGVLISTLVAAHWLHTNTVLRMQVQYLEGEIDLLHKARKLEAVIPMANCMLAAPLNPPASVPQPVIPEPPEAPTLAEPLKAGVAIKYALLLEGLPLGRLDLDALEQLMQTREQLLNQPLAGYFVDAQDAETLITEQQQKLAAIDDQVTQLLGQEGAARYELLKDSDAEQLQLREFEEALLPEQKFEPDTRVRLLLSKLRHKKNFEQALQSLNDLPTEVPMLVEEILKNVQRYQRNYYTDLETLMPEALFKKLKAAEDRRFNELSESLRKQLEQP